MRFALFLCFCAAAGLAQAGDLYRWVDADGKVHYTDQPPPAGAKKVEEKKLGGNTIDTSELPYATRLAVKKFPVTLYASDCGAPCDQARDHLNQRGIPYAAKNPQTTPADGEALKKLVGMLYVPVLVVGSTVSKGYETGAWDAALDAAGYPTSVLVRKPVRKAKPGDDAGQEKAAAEEKPVSPHPWARGR